MTTTSCPWQLHLFSLTNLLFGVVMMVMGIFDGAQGLCGWVFEGSQCNTRERLYSVYVGIGALYVFALFYMLTHNNKEKPSQLKRLASFAAICTVATFVIVMCLGPTSHGGVERSALHVADMIWFLLLFVVLVTAMADDDHTTPVAGSTSPVKDLKCLNPKLLVLLMAVGVLIKMFLISDFIDMSNYFVFDDEGETPLSKAFLSILAVFMFEILMVTVFALVYGDSKDQVHYLIVVIILIIISGLSLIPFGQYFQDGLIIQGVISIVVFLCLVIVSLWQHHKDQQREGYQSIDVVV